MKIYLITQGEYSDYRIHSAWTNKEKAIEVSRYVEDANDVEEYELDQVDAADGMVGWELEFSDNGDLVRQELSLFDYWDLQAVFGHGLRVNVKTPGYAPQLALKLATDKRARFLAEKTGLA